MNKIDSLKKTKNTFRDSLSTLPPQTLDILAEIDLFKETINTFRNT